MPEERALDLEVEDMESSPSTVSDKEGLRIYKSQVTPLVSSLYICPKCQDSIGKIFMSIFVIQYVSTFTKPGSRSALGCSARNP